MKKILFALVALAFGGVAQARIPECSAVCKSTTSACSNICLINGFRHNCGYYGVCNPNLPTDLRVQSLVEDKPAAQCAPAGASVRDALERVSPVSAAR
jgi:hypothetical protein